MTLELSLALFGCAAIFPALALRLSGLAAREGDPDLLPVRVRSHPASGRASR